VTLFYFLFLLEMDRYSDWLQCSKYLRWAILK
jgi:hypothetical protein